MPVSPKFAHLCKQCNSWCCKLVLPPITLQEKQHIINAGFTDHFYEIKKGIYGMKSNSNNHCPYLQPNNTCKIHNVKPVLCKIWPVVPRYKNKRRSDIIIKCPLYPCLTLNDIKQAKKEAKTIPAFIIHHLWKISPGIKEKYKRFEHEKI
jgi:Fe-S-cluster containining protein